MANYKLIGVGNNAKTVKGDGSEYLTAILYLLPDAFLCPLSTLAGCREGCLNTAGRGAMNSVQAARHRKSQWLMQLPEEFDEALRIDLDKFQKYCQKRDIQPVVRLNGTSDYNWKDVFVDYPEIQFYDYTKCYSRVAKNWPNNYHLTLSYSGANQEYKNKVIDYSKRYNTNLAVVFRDKNNIPNTFLGRPVINGDADDLRFLDPEGVVVALYAKGKAKKDNTGFVVDV